MKIRYILMVVIVFIMAITAGCGKTANENKTTSQGEAQKMELSFASSVPATHHINEECDFFKKQVESASKNQITLKWYPSQQLYQDKEMVEALPKGGAQIAQVNLAMWTGLVPSLGLYQIGALFKDQDHFTKSLDGAPGQEIAKELEEKGNLKFLAWFDYGAGYYFTSKQIQKLEDWKGVKMRTQADYDGAGVIGLGAVPTALSASELYMALQRKTVEGMITGVEAALGNKWYEVTKYAVSKPAGYGLFALVMNKQAWEKLTPEQQKIVMDAAEKTKARSREQSKAAEQAAFEKIKAVPGFTVVDIPVEEQNRWRVAGSTKGVELLTSRIGKERADKLINGVKALEK